MADVEEQKEPFLLSILPFAGLALLLGAALFWRSSPPEAEAPTPDPVERTRAVIERWEREKLEAIPVEDGDFTLGPEDAPITLVEFSDFECPYCRAGSQAVKQVLREHADDVRLVFKNLPLDITCNDAMSQQLHPFACRAALLARCAGASDEAKFWETHDALFRAAKLSEDVLERIPRELSLPLDELEACMARPETMAKVKEDLALAKRLSVSSTPTFFLDGRKVSDYRDGLLGDLVRHVLAKTEGG